MNSDPEINLLEKTELWIEGIILRDVRLDEIAAVIADVLGLERREVLVVDVREDHIVLDILRPVLKASQIAGKGEEILKKIAGLPGVILSDQACIHSEGALGWVALDAAESQKAIEKSGRMGREIRERVVKRAIVFSTGFEVEKGMIADTNYPLIEKRLREKGYTVKFGGILPDGAGAIAYQLQKALDEGFGLIITTGGVGAEAKDCTVEGLLRVDPSAATSYILKFEIGTGRHVKDGVRIAVGEVGISRFVALPGPTREVHLGLDRLLDALEQKWEKGETAEYIASALREKWRGHGHGMRHVSKGGDE
ncbi:competence/damage-inducible protein A [bacterium]|nr:MAG: competence/damage-inducible protein A [bacterium]